MTALGIVVLAFAAGSVPWSNVAARRARGVDLRTVGSGTVSGTALYRVAGFPALAVAGILDVAKGAVGPLLAGADRPTLAALAAAAAVAGHNWSPFLRGAGGRGIAPALGALLVVAWPGAVLLLGGLVVGRAVRQTGLAAFVAEVLLAPVLLVVDPATALTGLAITVVMCAKRVLGNAPPARRDVRTYAARLLYDRDPA